MKNERPEIKESRDAELLGRLLRTGRTLHNKVHGDGQEKAVWLLYAKGDMTQRELLNFFKVKSASLSELLQKIEAKGLIEREKSEEDKRNVNIKLTKSGYELAEIIGKQREEQAAKIFAILSEEEKGNLRKTIDKLLPYWEDIEVR